MSNFTPVGTVMLGGRPVHRVGYGAMQLAGPGVFGPPKDRAAAIALPIQSSALSQIADGIGATTMQVALAWLLHRSPNLLLIPGTSSLAHLRENLAAGQLTLSPAVMAELDAIAASAGAGKSH